MKEKNNKIFVVMPDGVGLRNFGYSGFHDAASERGFDITYLNSTQFPMSALGFKEIMVPAAKMHPVTYIYKLARKKIELDLNVRRTGDRVYEHYWFPLSFRRVGNAIKNLLSLALVALNTSPRGLRRIVGRIDSLERRTPHYRNMKAVMEREKPAFVFLTNQRQVSAIATMLAAKDLGIPTGTFIFSWDNLPKATMVVDTDYYFVWSELMKEQLMFYYPNVQPKQVMVTGTPQFEPHFDPANIDDRETFFATHGLDPKKKYICFSGDDVTTSPDDPDYLEDVALAVSRLNEKGYDLGIVFRRCPPDISGRYQRVLDTYSDIIVEIAPQWKALGDRWFEVLPLPEDVRLLSNTVAHTELVINLGSSMIFDYACFGKPCGYFNYNQPQKRNPAFDISRCYQYVHFRSMPSPHAVTWIDTKEAMAGRIEDMLAGRFDKKAAQAWFRTVNRYPPQHANERMMDAFAGILEASDKND